jgi:hypothetical protein
MEISDLAQIQNLAIACNEALSPRFSQEQRSLGGDLFLGRYYGESPRIFLGYNPGGQGEYEFKTSLCKINFWDDPAPAYHYWCSCKFFVNAAPGLHDWLDRATVGFCSPWRTRGEKEFRQLNRSLGGELYWRSAELVRMLIKHHEDKFQKAPISLIVAGKGSLDLLAREEFLGFDARRVMDECGAPDKFRCRMVQDGSKRAVYQVPHFSRVQGPSLAQCARWLAGHLLSR